MPRTSRSLRLFVFLRLVSLLALCASGSLSSAFAGSVPADPKIGDSHQLGGSWFVYAGSVEEGELWIYPHLDGFPEIFIAGQDPVWRSAFGTQFEPRGGRFANRFCAAEVLNELHSAPTQKRRYAAARLLQLFVELHDPESAEVPYYLREYLPRLERYLNDEGRAWVARESERQRKWLERIERNQPRLPSITESDLVRKDAEGYYLRLIEDGYLDIAVVGGNSYSEEAGRAFSWGLVEALRKKLERRGFRSTPVRRSEEAIVLEKPITLFGHSVMARARLTGAGASGSRTRRSVANFVEGLAHADVVIYTGHSNKYRGCYWASERRTKYARFNIGLDDQGDLDHKCHGLCEKPYQIVALMSCSSHAKYSRPVRWHYEEEYGHLEGEVGFMGTADLAYFLDFVPHYDHWLGRILDGAGPRELQLELNEIRPHDDTPPYLFRGVLQPRLQFIVPADEADFSITDLQEVGESSIVTGRGSDGRLYASTEIFPHDAPGEIVQVAVHEEEAYALGSDGRLWYVGADSAGAMEESIITKASARRFRFIAWCKFGRGKTRLALIDRDGRLYGWLDDAGLKPVRNLPEGEIQVVGNDAEGDLFVITEGGNAFVRKSRSKPFRAVDHAPDLITTTPSLLGVGVRGRLLSAEAHTDR